MLFYQRVQYGDQECDTTNIVFYSANQIADIVNVSNKKQ